MCKPVVTSRVQLRPLALQGPNPSGAARTNPPCQRCFATRKRVDGCAPRALDLYQQALVLAREEDYQAARGMFEEVVTACPHYSKAWVSWAQVGSSPKCFRKQAGLHVLCCPAAAAGTPADQARCAHVCPVQMEKRVCKCTGETGAQRFLRCREVLQRAMTLNPTDAELTQVGGSASSLLPFEHQAALSCFN